MSNKSIYAPLKLIQSMQHNYPNCFEIYEKRMKTRTADEFDFDIATDISLHFFPKPTQKESAEVCALLLTVIGEWRKSKQVFTFSEEIIEMIGDSDESILDTNVFSYLPYPCFYIETTKAKHTHGVFVKYIHDTANHHLLFLILNNNGTFCYNIFDLNGTSTFYTKAQKYVDEFEEAKYRESLKQAVVYAFQGALYLCAKNCDIIENQRQQQIYKSSNSIKDKFSEIRKWDVGFRIAKEMQKSALYTTPQTTHTSSTALHTRPREHWRKAHWHTYWVGKKGMQHKELRFVAPIHVNDIGDTLPVVVHTT